jgi:hypothetical protein
MRKTHRKSGNFRLSLILGSMFAAFTAAPVSAKEGLRDLADAKGFLFGSYSRRRSSGNSIRW